MLTYTLSFDVYVAGGKRTEKTYLIDAENDDTAMKDGEILLAKHCAAHPDEQRGLAHVFRNSPIARQVSNGSEKLELVRNKTIWRGW